MRTRSAAILFHDNSLALIERHRAGLHYFTFPGGGVNAGETPEQAVLREVMEELGLEVRIRRLVAKVWFRGNPQFFFLVEQTGGEFGTGAGEEFSSERDPSRGSYKPIWMPLVEVPTHNVLPRSVAGLVIQYHPQDWPLEPITITEQER
jgi:8-oxo-dGTP diphosphatase